MIQDYRRKVEQTCTAGDHEVIHMSENSPKHQGSDHGSEASQGSGAGVQLLPRHVLDVPFVFLADSFQYVSVRLEELGVLDRKRPRVHFGIVDRQFDI